jgi:ATP-dependent HslUV protease subunit HslV
MGQSREPVWHGTTILSVRKGSQVVIAGDGQVSLQNTILKPSARKVRRLADGRIITGFAGSTADALTLLERLEAKLERHPGQLMAVADAEVSLLLSGNGDVLEPDDGLIGIGSGGPFALAAARALVDLDDMTAEAIARKAMAIAADLCVYTNTHVTLEVIGQP